VPSIRFPSRASWHPDEPLLLDGAMGTSLQGRGLSPGDLPEAWVLDRPAEVLAVHRAHIGAGARLLLTCTFNAAAPRAAAFMHAAGTGRVCTAAVALARQAAPGMLVAGALGPLAVARPGGEAPAEAELQRPFEAAVRALANAGVDLLWLESQYDPREAAAALRAALGTGLPVVVTFTLGSRDGLLATADGGRPERLLLAAAAGGAAAVGLNCVPATPALAALARWARATLPVPFAVKPSPGLPGAELPPERFAAALAPAVEAGATLVGGCCGATAGHVAALASMLRDLPQAAAPRG
jgi:5-methyltetrahydrofolate--homocysteine methyltransferase